MVEADSLETKNTGNVALLVGGLIQAGGGTSKGSKGLTSTSRGRPGIRGYDFAREEDDPACSNPNFCVISDDCCDGFCCDEYYVTCESRPADQHSCEDSMAPLTTARPPMD